VRLLNAVWRGLGEALPNEGRGMVHLTKFVKDDVLGTVFQRTYRCSCRLLLGQRPLTVQS
jgi:hypothetical protein